jgi:hypothetical protein
MKVTYRQKGPQEQARIAALIDGEPHGSTALTEGRSTALADFSGRIR